jgi:hypothetical protein
VRGSRRRRVGEEEEEEEEKKKKRRKRRRRSKTRRRRRRRRRRRESYLLCGWQYNIDLCLNSYLPVQKTIILSCCFKTFLKLMFYILRDRLMSLCSSVSAIRASWINGCTVCDSITYSYICQI